MLPIGSGYHKQDGQASLNITKGENDSIYITATCDSLERLITYYEEENFRLRTSLEEKEYIPPDRKPTGWQWFWIRFGQLSAIIGAGWIFFRKLKTHYSKLKT